jgi:methyl-accepting chemotaxis protein
MKLPIIRSQRLLVFAFAAALLCVFVSGALEYWGLERLDSPSIAVHRGDAVLAAAADGMRGNLLELRRYEKDIFMNVGSDDLVRQYRAKWDLAFNNLWYGLVRARQAGSTSQDERLQQFVDEIADYRFAFARIYDLILDGTIRTTQQANQAMSPFKDSVHKAETTLAEIGSYQPHLRSFLGPTVFVQRLGLAATFLSFIILAVIFLSCARRPPAVNYAQ